MAASAAPNQVGVDSSLAGAPVGSPEPSDGGRSPRAIDLRVPSCSLVDGFLRPGANRVSAGDTAHVEWMMGAFGARQGARFTSRSVSQGNTTIVLKASGGTLAVPARSIEVRYLDSPPGGLVQILALDRHQDPAAPWVALSEPFPLALGDGDSLVAIADETGTVNVIVTTRTGPSWVGAAVLPEHHQLRFAGGRVGLRLAPTVTVDNFMGGDVIMTDAPSPPSRIGRMRA